jgi:tetratricopeptide (TPR) repeat protein
MSAGEWIARQRGRLAVREAEHRKAVGDVDAAVAAFERAAELDPGVRRQGLDAAATLLIEHGRQADAVPRLQKLVELDPKDAGSWRRLAAALLQDGDRRAAIKAWRRVLDADARDPEANQALAELLPEGAPERVPPLRVLAELAAPDDPGPWRRLAKALEQAGDPQAAVDAWRRVQVSTPADRLARDRLAILLEDLGHKAELAVELHAIAEDAGKSKSWKRYARVLEGLGQDEPAFRAWRRALEIDPADQQAHERMAGLLQAQGFHARATDHLRAVAEAGEDKRAWGRFARALTDLGRTGEAAAAWRRVLKIAPGELEAHTVLAELVSEPDERIAHLQAITEATPRKAEAWRALGRALTGAGHRDAAAQAWDRVLQLDGGDLEAHAAMAGLIGEGGPSALPHLQILAERGPDPAAARRSLGLLQEKLGDADGARQTFEALAGLEPDDPVPHQRLAQLLAGSGQGEAAAVHLRWLAERNEGKAEPWRRLAQALAALGDETGELEARNRLLALAPDEPKGREKIANLLERMGRKAEALDHRRAVAEGQTDQVDPWRRYARTLDELGRETEAFRAWRRVIELDPLDPKAHDRLAVLLLGQGLKARALEHLRILVESTPDRTSWRRLARLLTELFMTPEAVAAWRKVLEYAPAEAEAHTALAGLLEDDPAQALPHLRAVAETSSKDFEAWRRYARALTAVGETAAIDAWRKVLTSDEADIEAHAALVELIGERKAAALPHLEILAERGPDLALARRRLALLREKLGDEPGAAKAWMQLAEAAPDDAQAHERLSQLLVQEGDPQGALEHLRWLATHGPYPEKALRRLGMALAEHPDREAELETWLSLAALSPEDILAHGRSAGLLRDLGRVAEAAGHLKALAELEPGKPKAWRLYAEAAEEAGEAEGALAGWRQVLACDAKDLQADDELARILQGLGRRAEAAVHLEAAALKEPKEARRWRRLAACQAEAKDPDGEAEAWRRVLATDRADGPAHERLLQILEARGDKAGAAVHARALARLQPERPRPWRRLALLLDEARDDKGALQAWTSLLKLQPNDLAARERVAQLNLDLDQPARAAVHLQVLAGAEPDKARGWRRLALALYHAENAKAEARAWGHVLSIEPEDLQAHERLAHMFSETGREAEALVHLATVVRLAPENARAWRRYAKALTKAEPSLGAIGVWRRTLELAGQAELDAHLDRAEQTLERVQALKEELQASGAELKLQRGAAEHAKSRLEREERAHRATQGLLKDELAERRRLTQELQDSTQRQRQAEAEEESHLIAGRLLGVLEPPAGSETLGAGQSDAAAAYAEEALRAASGSGALIAAREAEARLAGVELTSPEALPARLRGKAKIVVLADADARARAAIREDLAAKGGLSVLDLDELVIRRAAGIQDLTKRVEPVGDDVWPARPLMVMSSDDRLRGAVVEAIGKATNTPIAPLFPAELASRVQVRELDLDDWLAAAWSAHGRPRVFGFQFDPESLALFAREIRSGRAQVMAKVFRRATALQLVWSDKALFAAEDHFARAGEVIAGFDAGDAQIEIKTYKRLVARDMLLESGLEQLGKFKPATVKTYRELFDKPALGRFCRDLSLSVGVAGFAEVDERSLGFVPPPELLQAGALIGEAVASLTAIREPEPPPQGLVQYGLGRSLEALGRHAEALEAYQEAVVRAPTYFPARAAAARYLELAGRPAEAERLLRQGLGNGTPDPDVQEGLLDFYQRNASPLGVAAVSRLMKKRGQSRPAVAAPALIELGRYREAAPLLKTIAPRIAGQDTFLNDLVDLPGIAGRLEELRSQAEGGEPAAQLRLAEALRRLGRLSESLTWYRRALAGPEVLEAEIGVGAVFRPRFLMVGPPRTGTTLLRRLFDLHPEIAAPPGELFFFSSRTGERAGSNRQRAPLAWYLDAFRAAAERKPDARLIGEKTPHYFSTSDDQMAFASLLLPDVKIIATLRDPVVRAWSEIKVRRRITEAEIVAALGDGGRPNWLAEVLDAGRYGVHLRRWLKHVKPEQLLLVDCDALETDVSGEAGRIFRWLGLRELSHRQVEELQQGWDNRTESFAPSAQVEALLRKSYENEAWSAAEVGRSLGLSQAPEPAAKPSRRRAAAK